MYKLLMILMLLVTAASAEQTIVSGLAPGDHAPAHHPSHITGPDAGTTICPV